ncbi:MAG: hypothetical protein II421_00335, partial [Bacteroidales bacterium]|nr:hypothetical protein [Bacteroidales bacterium]
TKETNLATVTGVIPATQTVTQGTGTEDHVFKPDMNNAYMYAYASASSGGDVTLSFKPLVTAVEFTLLTDSTNPITDNKLTKVTLSSTQSGSYLAGNFSATLNQSASFEDLNVTSGSNSIDIVIPGGGVDLSTSTAYTVTFLMLPQEQSKLTLTLTFADNSTKALKLKNDSDWLCILACKKTYIWKLAAPKTVETYTYTISATAPSDFAQAGSTKTYSVTSYKTGDTSGNRTAVSWTAEFSTDGGTTWSSDKPSWLTEFTTSGIGSATATNYSATAAENNSYTGWAGTTTSLRDSKSNAYDLSCYDIYGNFTGGTERSTPYNTANCYVVSAPGWYCFPCVYGNAITGGSDNGNAYKKGASDATNIMGAFKNHAGNGISDPWIKNNSVTIDGASILWQEVSDMIQNVSFESDYIYFYVNPSNIAQGNAVVTALAGSTVVWSWHIWVMDNPTVKLATKDVYSHASTNKSVVYPNKMMLMNLGTREGTSAAQSRSVKVRFSQTGSTEEAIITIKQNGSTASYTSTHYQWGRKDPFSNSDSYVSKEKSSTSTTPGLAIQNPSTIYYLSSSPYDWSTTRYDNLWNTNVTTYADSDLEVKKTIYDPCPPGFKVPNRNAFSGFSTTGANTSTSSQFSASNVSSYSTDKGYYFYINPSDHDAGTIFFPASGYRDNSNGSLYSVGSSGYCWSAAPYVSGSNQDGRNLGFSSGYVGPVDYNGRAHGFAVRPVVDNMTGSVTSTGQDYTDYDGSNFSHNWE